MATHPIFRSSFRRVSSSILAIVALVSLNSCVKELSYVPWSDLSSHFDLTKVVCKGSSCQFNSAELAQGKELILSEHIGDLQYNATVLGTGVWIRSNPYIAPYTQVCQVNTGDRLLVLRSAGYISDKYWSYVKVLSGRCAGRVGYICTDYLIEQEKFEVLQNYVFNSYSNISIETDSKYLNAVAVALLKFNVNKLHPHLYVTALDAAYTGTHHIVTYRLRNLEIKGNDSMLVFVQFTEDSNDFVILGIVPGSSVDSITRRADGSHDIYYQL